MKKFFKSKISIIILLLSFPIIFILIFKLCIKYLPGEMIGSIDGWLGFLGGYFGVLGAVGAIWYQKKLDNLDAINSINLYTNYIVENLSNKLEEHCIPFLTVFATLKDYDESYKIEEIAKRKRDFNIINTDIINSNLSLILSNKKFTILLNLKEKLDNLNYYIMKLEEDTTKGDITSLLDDLDKYNKIIPGYFSEQKKELECLRYILSRLNASYYMDFLNFEEEEIVSKYKFIIQDAMKNFNNKDKINLNILKCYENCISNTAKIIILINEKIKVRKFYYYNYNLLNLINILATIYEDIEKLKSTK